ncbi:36507_t:CDS:1, partial [Racocetra persica]
MYYAANKLDLRSVIYLIEFITFPLIANDRKDLTILQDWVMKDAQQEGLDVQAIQQSSLNARMIEGMIKLS